MSKSKITDLLVLKELLISSIRLNNVTDTERILNLMREKYESITNKSFDSTFSDEEKQIINQAVR